MGEPSGVECLDTHAELGALFRLGLQYPRCGALMSSRPVWDLSASSARLGVRGGGAFEPCVAYGFGVLLSVALFALPLHTARQGAGTAEQQHAAHLC